MNETIDSSRRGSGRPPSGAPTVRDALLRAAATNFSAYGYAGSSARMILADAAATAPALYHHFGNKTGLYVAAATAAQERVLATFEAATADRREGVDRVSALFEAAVELRREHPNVARYLNVIQQDVARHLELAELNSYEPKFDQFWRSVADVRRAPGEAVALRAAVEGLLNVGGAHIRIEDVAAGADTLKEIVARGLRR